MCVCATCATCNTHTYTHGVAPIECKWSNSVSYIIKCVSCVFLVCVLQQQQQQQSNSVANATSRLNRARKEMLQHVATTTRTQLGPNVLCVFCFRCAALLFLICKLFVFVFVSIFVFVFVSIFDAVQWLKRQNAQKLVYNFSLNCCCCCCSLCCGLWHVASLALCAAGRGKGGDSLKRWG